MNSKKCGKAGVPPTRNFKNNICKVPKGWDKYTNMGSRVPGTRFLPFKTPLKEEVCQKWLSDDSWFTPAMLLEKAPNLKLIIDLTQTAKYYRSDDVVRNGIRHKKIVCPGGGKQLPSRHIIHEFFRVVDAFLQSEGASDKNALIGVHCTHGLNRTGYLICKYMVERCGIPPSEAVEAFENSRGHKMERELYIRDVLRSRQLPPLPQHKNRLPRMANPYHRPSPLDGCYAENKPRYSDRNVFYPRF